MISKILLVILSSSFLNASVIIYSEPPKPWEKALTARYVIHESDWISIATVSSIKWANSHPFVNIKSMSDGPKSQGTGVPYLFMTDLDFSGADLQKDSRCTLMASLAESSYCADKQYDPQDPRCTRVILMGHFEKVDNTTAEYTFASNALYSRHPEMKTWPLVHNFYIGKVVIEHIIVLNDFGGADMVDLKDYYNANSTMFGEYNKIS